MIVTTCDKRIALILAGQSPKGFPSDLLRGAIRKLLMLDAATFLGALRLPPSNHPEALSGDRKGQHSIRIHSQWRICFVWTDGDAFDVEIVDCHWGARTTLITNPPIHPGEILRTEFMEPPNLTPGKIARAIGVPRTRIERRIRKQTALTADTAARLGRYLGTRAEFWMNLRTSYDASVAHLDPDLQRALDAIVPRPEPEARDEAA